MIKPREGYDTSHMGFIFLECAGEECEIQIYTPDPDKAFPSMRIKNSKGEQICRIGIYEALYKDEVVKLTENDKINFNNFMNDDDPTYLEMNITERRWRAISGIWNPNFIGIYKEYTEPHPQPDYTLLPD